MRLLVSIDIISYNSFMFIEKKIPINCEEMQYFQEEQSDSDYDYDGNIEDKMNSAST